MSAREKIAAALNKLADNLGLADGEERPIEPGDGIADYTVRDMDKIANAAERLSEYTGGGGGSSDMFFVVHNVDTTSSDDQLDKTGQEIVDAYNAGKIIIMVLSTNYGTDFDDIQTDFGKMTSITDDSMQIEGMNVSYSYTTDTYGLSSYPKIIVY